MNEQIAFLNFFLQANRGIISLFISFIQKKLANRKIINLMQILAFLSLMVWGPKFYLVG
jgi:hypothetical protein